MKAKTFSTLTKNPSGVSMLQFVLVLPIIVAAVALIIDIGRYYAVKNLLDYGARQGVEIARSVPNLDIDIQGLDPADISYIRYKEARKRVAFGAMKTPLQTLLKNYNQDGDMKLVKYKYEDNVAVPSGDPFPTQEYGAGLILPYESLERIRDSETSVIEHPSRAPVAGATINKQAALKAAPIMVEVSAEINLLLPFLKPLVVSGRAFGFREFVPQGPFDQQTEEALGIWTDYLDSRTTTSTGVTSTVTSTSSTTSSTICRANWTKCNDQSKHFFDASITSLCPNPKLNSGSGDCECERCDEVLKELNDIP